MTPTSRPLFCATALAALLPIEAALAQSAFADLDRDYAGQVTFEAPGTATPIVPGSDVTVSGSDFAPDQEVTLVLGGTALNDGAYVAGADGAFEAILDIPDDAVPGIHPVLVEIANPAYGDLVELKVSPDIGIAGAEMFEIENASLEPGLYQVAHSAGSDMLFVTSAVGRPPVERSALMKIDPETLEIVARSSPSEAPAREDGGDGGLVAVYGVDVDDAHGNVWVTNTRQDTVAVYAQDDLSLVHQFEPGLVPHSRDVRVDEDAGRAYVSATFTPDIHVFDTGTMEHLETISIESSRRRGEFTVASIALAEDAGKLVTVSLGSDEVAMIDTASGEVENVWPLDGVGGTIGVAYDPVSERIFTASQGSDDVLIVDAADGEILHEVSTGAEPLNVAHDDESGLLFVANRGSGTVTAIDPEGEIVANLEIGTRPNHLIALEDGTVYVVNKAAGQDDPQGDMITRIAPAE